MGNRNRNRNNSSLLYILPIVLIVMIVPLLIHMREVPISPSAAPVWKGVDTDSDFFSFYKAMYFLGFTFLAALALVVRLAVNNYKIIKSFFYIPMGAYALFVILSTITSKEKDVSLLGFPNRYEGLFVLLAYMLIMFLIINLVDNIKQIKLILAGLVISAVVIGLIAVFQYFNMDLFQTELGKKIMLPYEKWGMLSQLSFSLGPRAAYGTLYHTNYVGSFVAMVLPIALGVYIFAKDLKYKVGSGFLTVLMFASLMASHSRAGFAGVGVAVFFVLIITRRKLIRNAIWIGALAVVIIATGFGIDAATKGQITDKIGTLYNDSAPALSAVAGIKEVAVTKDVISLSDGINTLKISYKNSKIKITDTNDKIVSFSNDAKANKITFVDPRYAGYILSILNFQGHPVVEIVKSSFKMDFVVTPNGYKLYDGRGYALDIEKVESWGFKGYENLGSARGYIWSRSIPLMKNTAFTGFGPDTFAIHFPQNDYIGKLLAYNDPTIIVDKPHNIYLQAAINTGVPSLIALLALFIMYFISSVKLFIKNEFNSLMEVLGAGIFTAVFGYLVAGLANDSSVSVAPIFWVLLGIGISINMVMVATEQPINQNKKSKLAKSGKHV